TAPAVAPPPRLRFSLGPELEPLIQRAKRHLDSLAADVDLYCFSHPGVTGGSRPLDPQALLQVALQVAYYRLHGCLCASCQPTTLDPLLPGVSDLLRPPGALCLALAKALGDPTEEPEQQLRLLEAALEAQGRSFREVLAGEGPERHLQRLRQVALGGGEPLPRLFLEPAVTRSTHFRLCSVQVHSREPHWLLRGPLVPDGYGVGVIHVNPPLDPSSSSPGPSPPPELGRGELRVAVTSFSCCRETEAAALGGKLREVLQELGGLLQGYQTP
ncbi:CACP acetyltransferase, partial [Rhinopomastus cyanomelas]|nr:CACP acetyltransferase [Rhinopomastus cyanomelas]